MRKNRKIVILPTGTLRITLSQFSARNTKVMQTNT